MPNMSPKYLGVYLLLSTQLKWAHNVFVDHNFNDLKDVGLTDQEFLDEFYTNFTKDDNLVEIRREIKAAELLDPQKTPGLKDIHLKLFQILVLSLKANAPKYSPPPCPSAEAVKSIIAAINNAAVAEMARK